MALDIELFFFSREYSAKIIHLCHFRAEKYLRVRVENILTMLTTRN